MSGTQGDGSSGVRGTVLLTTFESKHLEKQPSAVQNGIHLTPAAERTRFINRLDVLQRKHQGGVKGTVLLTTIEHEHKGTVLLC